MEIGRNQANHNKQALSPNQTLQSNQKPRKTFLKVQKSDHNKQNIQIQSKDNVAHQRIQNLNIQKQKANKIKQIYAQKIGKAGKQQDKAKNINNTSNGSSKNNQVNKKQNSIVGNKHKSKQQQKKENKNNKQKDQRKDQKKQLSMNKPLPTTQLQQSPMLNQNVSQIKQNLAITHTLNELQNLISFTQLQESNLKLYFKYISQHILNLPKSTTFEMVKNIYNTISLALWMFFCKNLGILQKIKLSRKKQGIKWLSRVYKRNEDNQKRMNFQGFIASIREVIMQMAQNYEKMNFQQKKQLTKQVKIRKIIEWLSLDNKIRHREKLKQLGVMCSQNLYCIPKKDRRTQRVKIQNQSIQQHKQRSSVNIIKNKQPQTTFSPDITAQKQKLPKIYRSHQDRKQSKLMHSLALSNINKLSPNKDTKDFIQKFIGYDDRYLKQYFKKQQTVKNGIISKLQNNQNRNPKYKSKTKY